MSRKTRSCAEDDEILNQLLDVLAVEDWIRLRRGLALLHDETPTERQLQRPEQMPQ